MSFTLGNKVNIEVTGASHAPEITVRLSGIPKGRKVDFDKINELLARRAGGKVSYTTQRKEADTPVIESGFDGDVTTGEPIFARFINSNQRSGDYGNLKYVPRPSHADFAAYTKYNGNIDLSGGGFFSGRMTLTLCFAGAVCKQLLEQENIFISAHIKSVGSLEDASMDPVSFELEKIDGDILPVIDKSVEASMDEMLKEAAADGDSVGGIIECKAVGLPVGLGDPIYDSLESRLSMAMFGIPAIKGIEFGRGFEITKLRGSEANDPFIIKDSRILTSTNNSGGIQGGMSNGMPVLFKVAVKPTPSIYKEQDSVDIVSKTPVKLKIEGRHDACITVRAVPCVEAVTALVLYESLIEYKEFIEKH